MAIQLSLRPARPTVESLTAENQALRDRLALIEQTVANRLAAMQEAHDAANAQREEVIQRLETQVQQLNTRNLSLADRQDFDSSSDCCSGGLFGCVAGIFTSLWCVVQCCFRGNSR